MSAAAGIPLPGAPAASVIVPVFNARDHIEACLDALLAQHAPPLCEIVVVDNGSTDGTREAVASVAASAGDRLRLLTEERPGSYAARNRGIQAAAGEILLFTDADCRPSPGWAAGLVRALAGDPDVLAAGGEVEPLDGSGGIVARYSAGAGILRQEAALGHPRGPFLQTASLAVRARDIRDVGGFDSSLPTGGDADLCLRLAAARPGRLLLVPGVPVFHAHRTTVAGLFRQFRRYGQGDWMLWRRYGGSLAGACGKLALDLLRVALAPAAALLLAPLALIRRDPVYVAAPLLRAVRIAGRLAGRIHAVLRPGALHRA